MDTTSKQQWSMDETNCLLVLWSSTEIQREMGASRTKPVFEKIQHEMATAGFDRNVEQIINKLKKLKKEYRDQKKDLGRSGNGWPRRNPHFNVLDSVLGDRQACQLTRALNSATAMLEAMVDDTLLQSTTDAELSANNGVDADAELPPPLDCSLTTPSSSSGAQSSSSSSHQARQDTLQFRFSGYGDSILHKMNLLRDERRFCDVTLVLGAYRFPGHRVVLAASSAFLRDQFLLHEGRELPVHVVPNGEVGRRLLLSCYSGFLEVPRRELVRYLTAASALQMSHVVERCAEAVSQYLGPTLADVKQERISPESTPPPDSVEPSSACLEEVDQKTWMDPEDREHNLDLNLGRVQMVHTKSPNPTGAQIHKHCPSTPSRDYRTFSPVGSPSHRAGVADSSQDQEVSREAMYMLAAHMQGRRSPESQLHIGLTGAAEHLGQDLFLQRPYLCRKCDRVFQHLTSFVGHLKEHKLYPCLLCGKSFSQKSNLTRHIRVHTGVKPFQCLLCHKTFSQKATLQDHLNLHTGNKPHKCNYCAIHFAHKPGLRRHLKDIHGKSSFQNMFQEVVD